MRLAFLCSSLEPGRDGVGDYCRRLAAACADLGHRSLLVALNERGGPPDPAPPVAASECRTSAAVPWPARAEWLGARLREFQPDWVSWQVVAYGFHPKGILPSGLGALVEAVRPWPSHAMLHELWLGLARSAGLKERLLGAWQRRRLLGFLKALRPASIHTTNTVYRHALARRGWQADLLPLFGNIPPTPVPPAAARAALAGLPGAAAWDGEHRCVGVLFGTIHPQWRAEPTLAWLRRASEHAGRPLALLALGRIGNAGTRTLARIARSENAVPVAVSGPLPPEAISRLLQAADFGIATHPWALIAKSGSTIAMLEHGLPVLVPRDDWRPADGRDAPPDEPLLRRPGDLSDATFGTWIAGRGRPASRLPGVAARFAIALEEAAVPVPLPA